MSSVPTETKAVPTRRATRFDMLCELLELGNGETHPPTTYDVDNHGSYSVSEFADEFGTWPAALEAAGYTRASHPDRVTRVADGGTAEPFTANRVRELLDSLHDEDFSSPENVPETLEDFAREVVETGTLTPDATVTADLSLTPRERLTGHREQDITAILTLGMLLGTALEADVPTDTEDEVAWLDGAFTLPDGGAGE